MLWRHLCPVRVWSTVGLFSGLMILGSSLATAQSRRPDDPEKISAPANVATETVGLLKASKVGDLSVLARGQGQDRVRLTIRNTSSKRLNVVLPAGLVASAAAGQGQGRGLQSMGLGMFSNRPGSFGQFRGSDSAEALQSVAIGNSSLDPSLSVPAGESLDVTVTAVCLNFGLPTPTPRDRFTLVDVADYSTNSRVRKSLRSLCQLGTSQGVAQAVMWRVCNELTFEAMAAQAGKVVNEHEIALAARFIEALDQSAGADLVDARALTEGRVFVNIQGEGALASDAERLSEQVEKFRLLGLPVRVVDQGELPSAQAALFIKVVLTDGKTGETCGRIVVSYSSAADQWTPLGKARFQDTSPWGVLDGKAMSQIIDRAIGAAFVRVKPTRRTVGSTTLKVDNHLPFTLATVAVKAGNSAGSPTVPFRGLGVGPARSALLPIQAATATIERVELNGL
ncbi:MAG TPA: hypothetical protein VKF17_09665 [Isosphaeraceae bacterium]|nr:hypothetical protein [Isosphaeraceae bacterium]